MSLKVRLSGTVDAHLLEAAETAVAAGRSGSVSSWVNDALRLKRDHDQRLAALRHFIDAYEAEHGEIAPEEIQAARRDARARAVVVRQRPGGKRTARR